MPSKTLPELPAVTTIEDADQYYVVRGAGDFHITGSNLLASPTPIGAVTPNALDGTIITANAPNSGGKIIIRGYVMSPTDQGAIYCGVTPGAGNYAMLFNPTNFVALNGFGGVPVRLQVQLDTILECTGLRGAFTKPVNLKSYTVGTLPSGLDGDTAFVTDSSTTIILGLGLVVIGGGSNKVPVYYDGAWKIG